MTASDWGPIGTALNLARPLPCLVRTEGCSSAGTEVDPVGAGPGVEGLADRIDTVMLMAFGALGVSVMIAVGAVVVAVVLLRSQRDGYLLPAGPVVRRLDDESSLVSGNATAVPAGGWPSVPAVADPPRAGWG